MHRRNMKKHTSGLRKRLEDILTSMERSTKAFSQLSNGMRKTFKKLRKYTESEAYFRKAMDGQRRVLGHKHPSTLESIHCFAKLLLKLERYEEAEQLLRLVVESREEIFGKHDQDTIASGRILDRCLLLQGKLEDFEEALTSQEPTSSVRTGSRI